MISFLKSRLWIFHSFIFLSVLNHSRAQGDPDRIPTGNDRAGIIYLSKFKQWPACASDCGLQPALNSSIETWCTVTFFGGCMDTDTFVRTSKFCSLVGSSPCPANQCLFPREQETLSSWVNTACNLTAEAKTLWNEAAFQRADKYRRLKPFDSIGKRPSCSDACPGLVTSFKSSSFSKSLLNTTNFCAGLVGVDGCREACTFGNEPRKLFGWVNNICGNEVYGRETWRNVTMAKEAAWVFQWIPALFPWNWTVQAVVAPPSLATMGIEITDPLTSSKPYSSVPPSGPGVCKTSTSKKLGVFAAVNVVSAILLPILGRRTVVSKLSRGKAGKLGSSGWPMMGLFSAALNVVANAVNAHLIRSTPGYENVPVGALTLLWCTRPRLAWLAVFLAAIQPDEGMYFNCAASAITSETILQIIGAVYFGLSANYGRQKRLYLVGHLDPYPRGVDAHVMYAGALVWLLMSFIMLIACIVCIVGLGEVIANARRMVEGLQDVVVSSGDAVAGPIQAWLNGPLGSRAPEWLRRRLERQKNKSIKAEPRRLTAGEIQKIQSIFSAGIIFMSFMAQWLFWAGFVKSSQERYCPPNIVTLGAIWGLFSGIGTFVGSAH